VLLQLEQASFKRAQMVKIGGSRAMQNAYVSFQVLANRLTSNGKYVPIAQENVIGTIVGRAGVDGWRVDIGGAHQANLDGLAFEGATKRNKPNLKVES
jgi:exosome complex RNA-binding protein Rrp4